MTRTFPRLSRQQALLALSAMVLLGATGIDTVAAAGATLLFGGPAAAVSVAAAVGGGTGATGGDGDFLSGEDLELRL